MVTPTQPATYQCTPAARAALAVWARPGSTVPLPPDFSKNWEVTHADTWELVAISSTRAVARMRLRQGEVVEVSVEEGFLAQMLVEQYARSDSDAGLGASLLAPAASPFSPERLDLKTDWGSAPLTAVAPTLVDGRQQFVRLLKRRATSGSAPLLGLLRQAADDGTTRSKVGRTPLSGQRDAPRPPPATWLPPGQIAGPRRERAAPGANTSVGRDAFDSMTDAELAKAIKTMHGALQFAVMLGFGCACSAVFVGADALPLSIGLGAVSVWVFTKSLRRLRRLTNAARQRA